MGTVYLARDAKLDRPVAIKVPHPSIHEDKEWTARFKAEAKVLAQLRHPNIITIHDFVAERGRLAIVMEYIDGASLEGLLKLGPIDQSRARSLLAQILGGMAHAHQQGFVHRDLKPSNILVERVGSSELAKVTDFGIVKIFEVKSFRTVTGAKIGTPAYMSPEQILGSKSIDHRTDIYSLGAVLFEAVTGVPPFDADSEFLLMKQILEGRQPDPLRLAPTLARPLRAVILKAMSREPAQRFQSCAEFLSALQSTENRVATHQSSEAQTSGGVGEPRVPARHVAEPNERGIRPTSLAASALPQPAQPPIVRAAPLPSQAPQLPLAQREASEEIADLWKNPRIRYGLVGTFVVSSTLYAGSSALLEKTYRDQGLAIPTAYGFAIALLVIAALLTGASLAVMILIWLATVPTDKDGSALKHGLIIRMIAACACGVGLAALFHDSVPIADNGLEGQAIVLGILFFCATVAAIRGIARFLLLPQLQPASGLPWFFWLPLRIVSLSFPELGCLFLLVGFGYAAVQSLLGK